MRIPYEKRVDRYDVEWRAVEPDGDQSKAFKYATITIHELWSIGHIIFAKEPLKIEVYFGGDEKTSGQSEAVKEHSDSRALIVYDFGMEDEVPLKKENNWLYNYGGPNEEVEPIKTVFSSIKFDLMHAFFHYSGDPNYGHTHWALVGHLRDRVTADDSFICDDYDYEEAKKKAEMPNKGPDDV